MNSNQQQGQESYKVLLIDQNESRVFVKCDGQEMIPPTVEISLFSRPAEQITSILRSLWGVSAVVIDFVIDEADGSRYVILEAVGVTPATGRCEFRWLPLLELCSSNVSHDVRASLSQMLSGTGQPKGPFSRFGWLRDALKWLSESRGQECSEASDIRQLNASGTFALIRLGFSSGPAYWLKAVGAPNTNEFLTMAYLVRTYQDYLPPVLAMRRDWNAWLMEDVGDSLHSSRSLEDFARAAERLAELQRDAARTDGDLIANGFFDHRVPALDAKVDATIDYLVEAMSLQTSTKVSPLSRMRLLEIGGLLHSTFEVLDRVDIPNSILHGDISPGSILSDGARCVFTDWCEAYVGNPFITLEQFCVHAKRIPTNPAPWLARIKAAYCGVWRDLLSEEQLHSTLSLTPLLSLFSYLYGRGDWLSNSRRLEPAMQGYARALARHMDRVVDSEAFREALCHLR